jgi:ABC-type transport system involved in multi-copper enzyme maturation permease subunit
MWVDTEALNPREIKLHHLARVLQIVAVIQLIIVIGIVALIALFGVDSNDIGQALAFGLGEGATLMTLVGLVANMSACLLLAVSILAQEGWSWFILLGTLLANLIALVAWGFVLALIMALSLSYIFGRMVQERGAFHNNPVTIKELRGRMRGVRSFAIISVFLALMGIFTVLLYVLALSQISGTTVVETGQLGRTLFRGVVGVELVLIVLIVPAFTAGAVTGERERQTFDLLTTTLLPAPTFLVGKMSAALGYMFLLILAAIPLQSVAFLFGGVSQTEIFLAVVGLLATALLLGALGLFFSAMTERTLTATVRVYTLALALVFGLPFLSTILFNGAYGYSIVGVGIINNNAPLEARSIYADMLVSGLNPIITALYTQQILVDHQSATLFNVRLASNGDSITLLAPWVILVVAYIATAGLLLLGAIWQMRRNNA